MPVLLEVDVTVARRAIRAYRRRTGRGLSFTAWVVGCVARAAAEHPRVHAVRRGSRQLVLFHEADVAVVIERSIGTEARPETVPMPCVIRNAAGKSAARIHDEIRQAQTTPVAAGATTVEAGASPWLQAIFFRMPGWFRDLTFWYWLLRSPERIKRTMGTIVVTSVGAAMPDALAWGIPISLHPLAVSVGGIVERGSGDENTEVLALTVVFDHAVTDGAPVGRFLHRLRQLMTEANELTQTVSGDPAPVPD